MPASHDKPKPRRSPAAGSDTPDVPARTRPATKALTKAVGASAPPAATRTRDRAASEERILGAVAAVLARDGFGAVGVNAIAREAGVDKVLIYRYFGGLPELLQAWGASGRFWPSVTELLGEDAERILARPPAERFALFFERFIDALRARPLTIEILAAEIVERNELTAILEAEREHWGEQAEALLGADVLTQRPHLRGTALLLIGGVQYLLVRARTLRVFGGQDLHEDATWTALKASIRATAEALL
ncbi:helix-turn-helix domain-containing protein [Niveibacterium sp. SC-1]|uniref:TetR/AcrR family transcriptional regulator n=1 Tax=Niveibacterium sp. SC-1 TaxID=3135646 RepID=UPI00311F787A